MTEAFPSPHGDWLSRLLDLVPVSGRVDHHCLFGAPWQLDNKASATGTIPYHVVLSGTAILHEVGSANDLHLRTGDILILPHGSAHILHDGSGKPPAPATQRATATVMLNENQGTGDRLDMLCGSFLLSPTHERMVRAYFPSRFVVHGSGPGGPGMTDELAHLLGLMRRESSGEALGGRAMLDALSAALFAYALRLASREKEAPVGLLALAGHAKLAPALSAMFDEPGRAWTLPELAGRCNMSRATFIRQFQSRLGRTSADLLTDIRMTLAANQLGSSSASTLAVAESAGYQSEAAFQRAFKARMGVSPAAFRREAASRRARDEQSATA
ncbi:cupin domain-containing protein [Sphingopyxis panaciterrae]